MKEFLFLFVLCLSSMALSGEWKFYIENRDTGENYEGGLRKGLQYFPERRKGQWQCAIDGEETIGSLNSAPIATRAVACLGDDEHTVTAFLECEDLSNVILPELLLDPKVCQEEIELKDLGGDVPNIKLKIEYEWWK